MKQFNYLGKRLIFGLLGSIIIVSCIIYSEWSYFVVFAFMSFCTQYEFYKLIKNKDYLPFRWLGVFVGFLLFVLNFFIAKKVISYNYYFVLICLASTIFVFKMYKKNDATPFINIALFYLGIIYVALPFSLANFIVFSNGSYDFEIIFGILIIIWASDTGAYFAGTIFGKTQLFKSISPKKSWEGAIGGLLFALFFAYILSKNFDFLHIKDWIIISFIIVVTGIYGDLTASQFKRSIAVKDSGKAIPGHGGFLDRFDSLIYSLPFILVYLIFFN